MTHHRITRQRTVNPMPHPASSRTKHELARATVDAFPAHHRRRRQNRYLFAAGYVFDVLSCLHNNAGKFVTENYRRIVLKGIVVYMEVCTTNAAITYFNLDLLVATTRFRHFTQIDITDPRLIFEQSLHA